MADVAGAAAAPPAVAPAAEMSDAVVRATLQALERAHGALAELDATQRQFHASLEREGKDFDANVEAELYKIGPLLSRMPQYRDKALRLAKRMRAVRERVDRIKRAAAKLRREATQSGAAASAATAPASGPAGEGGVASDSELP